MSMEEEKNILIYGKPGGTIEIKPHPEDVIEVDPAILANMNARLKGESFDDVYGSDDRVTKEFLIRKETEKLKRIFGTSTAVFDAFSSLTQIRDIRKELQFEEIDQDLLASYSIKKSGGAPIDEVDVYAGLLNGTDSLLKSARVDRFVKNNSDGNLNHSLFTSLRDYYLANHFKVLSVNRELIQLDSSLQESLKTGRLIHGVNALLSLFYKVAS